LRPEATDFGMTSAAYGQKIEATKEVDAYHSLSIERYRVTPELISRVAAGEWAPESETADRKQTEAMAARGYLDAFSLVRDDAVEVFASERSQPGTAARVFSRRHGEWFAKLFSPSVTAGLLKREDLVGYRRHMVFLRGSRHVPPQFDHVSDGMTALGECLAAEEDAFVRAVLSHWLLGFIHPYMDGNGRMARFAMNLQLASGGYPWTVIRVENREAYMQALERASVDNDVGPFAAFVAASVRDA
jgi:Fic family protein